MDRSYMGFYAEFETVDKTQGGLLTGPDNLVGDDFTIFFKTEDGRVTAWLKNKFDKEVGYFNVDASRKLQLAAARELSMRAVLSFVAYSDSPDPGHYWGEMAVFCYSPAYAKEIDSFIDRMAEKLGEGIRPNIDLGSAALEKVFANPSWAPSETVPLPKKETGMAVLKYRRSMSEKMIEQGRAGNKGCYAVSILFLVALAVGLLYLLHTWGLF